MKHATTDLSPDSLGEVSVAQLERGSMNGQTFDGEQSFEHPAELNKLADNFVSTDSFEIKKDVCRLGSIRAAAEYSSEMAAGQPTWEALATESGVAALEAAVRDVVMGMRVAAGEGDDRDTGVVNTIDDGDGENVTVNWDSLVTTPASFRSLSPL